jgi:hypothetical protein
LRAGGSEGMNENNKLNYAVDEFALAMKERLTQKHKQGFTGWNNKDIHANSIVFKLFYKASEVYSLLNFGEKRNLKKKVLVDIANFAMFIWRKL